MLEKIIQRFTKREPKADAKQNSVTNTLNFDLLYQLSYMSVIASAGVPRRQIFERSAELGCASADYFRKIEILCQGLRFDYSKACRLVGDSAPESEIKGLLLRFSSSLLSGEPEADFLARESEAQAEAYENDYTRKLETLKMWTEAYISLSLAAVLIIIIGIVSTMIWKIETSFVIGLVMVSIMTTSIGVWLIYLISPREIMIVQGAGSKEQKQAKKAFGLVLPIGAALCSILMIRGIEMGWMLLVVSALIFPVGWISMADDKKIVRRDAEVGPFLGSLGGVCGAIGTTVKEALGRIDLDAIDVLKIQVKRLHARLCAGIRTKLCWRKFIEETGSELANRSVGMFYDAIDLGGDPQQAGYRASLFASKLAMLRARRKTVAAPFRWLCVAMHASLVVLLVFITEVMSIFGTMLHQAAENMPDISGSAAVTSFTSFNFAGLELMHSVMLPLVLVFTISDALAPGIADGGSRYKLLYNLGITSVITGACLLALPPLAAALFSSTKL